MVKLVGDAVLAFVNYLIAENQFKQDSEIRNLGLVLALFLVWGEERYDVAGEHGVVGARGVDGEGAVLAFGSYEPGD